MSGRGVKSGEPSASKGKGGGPAVKAEGGAGVGSAGVGEGSAAARTVGFLPSAVPNERLLRLRWERARRSPLVFLRKFVFTNDQHEFEGETIKPFPVSRPQIAPMVHLWKNNRLLSILKCRQVVMTWLFSALSLWDAMFHQGRLIMLQSKRLDDAVGSAIAGDGPLGRAKFIFNHIPCGKLLCPESRDVYDRLEFPGLSSTLWAIPQGGAIIRQRTASGIFSDETAFQPESEDAYVAARPCIRGGGWYVQLTTASLADGGHTRRLHQDILGEDEAV